LTFFYASPQPRGHLLKEQFLKMVDLLKVAQEGYLKCLSPLSDMGLEVKNISGHLRSKSIKQQLLSILILSEHIQSIRVLAALYC